MATHLAKCPFSKIGCVECPIYRGRHCFISPANGCAAPRRVREEDGNWAEGFEAFFGELEADSRRCIDRYADSV